MSSLRSVQGVTTHSKATNNSRSLVLLFSASIDTAQLPLAFLVTAPSDYERRVPNLYLRADILLLHDT